jgi:hypothetical protein
MHRGPKGEKRLADAVGNAADIFGVQINAGIAGF